MYNPFSLANKTILVTGASSGIGRAVAIECSRMGAKLIISGRNEERLQQTRHQLEGTGHIAVTADLTDQEGIKVLVEKADKLSGAVFCAGKIMAVPFTFCNRDKVQNLFDINFLSPTELCHQLVKNKKLCTDGASVVFISSVSGPMVGVPGSSAYSASKAALTGLVKGVALELAAKQIRVNAVLPGMIETPVANETEELITTEALDADKKRYPLKRYGKPEEVAYGVIYLLSDAARWITGSNLVIDGGITVNC